MGKSARYTIRLGLSLVMTMKSTFPVASYVVDGNARGTDMLSRFADVQCKLLMTVGRTPNSDMPPEWAASGAKLGLALDVWFLSKGCPPEISQDTLLGGADLPPSSLLDVVPLNEPSFIGVNGQERVKVTPGAFSCRIQIPDTQQYNLNFFVDFPEGATRNDVVLPAEKIYFMTACWNEDDNLIKRAKGWRDDILVTLEQVGNELEEIGRLPIHSRTSRFRQYFTILERRRKLVAQLDMLEDTFPPEDRMIKGPKNVTLLKEGVIAVKRHQGGHENYVWVGTFKFQDVSLIPTTTRTSRVDNKNLL